MRRSLIPAATLALATLLLPWAQTATVAVHLASAHHHGKGSHHIADLEDARHGHHHSDSEPRHEHAMIGQDVLVARASVSSALTAPLSVVTLVGQIRSNPALTLRLLRVTGTDHDPPGARTQKPILRI